MPLTVTYIITIPLWSYPLIPNLYAHFLTASRQDNFNIFLKLNVEFGCNKPPGNTPEFLKTSMRSPYTSALQGIVSSQPTAKPPTN